MAQFRDSITIQEKILSTYRGWHCWCVKNYSHEQALLSVIADDMSNALIKPNAYESLGQIEYDLNALLDALEKAPLKHYHSYTVTKLRQSIDYIRRIDSRSVTTSNFMETGVKWALVSEKELDSLSHDLQDAIDTHRRAERASTTDELYLHIEVQDAASRIEQFGNQWKKEAFALCPSLVPFIFTHSVVPSQSTWRNLTTHPVHGDQFILYVNSCDRVSYTDPFVRAISAHEVCGHMAHFAVLGHSTLLQANAPHLLCIAIHTQDAYLVEGVAQLMAAHVIGSSSDTRAKIGFHQMVLEFALRHGNIVGLVSGEFSLKEAAERHSHYLASCPKKNLNFYKAILRNPLFCCQMLTYHSAFMSLKPLLSLEPSLFEHALDELMNHFYDSAELDVFVERYTSRSMAIHDG